MEALVCDIWRVLLTTVPWKESQEPLLAAGTILSANVFMIGFLGRFYDYFVPAAYIDSFDHMCQK